MRRIHSLSLIVLFLLTLTACGGSEATAPPLAPTATATAPAAMHTPAPPTETATPETASVETVETLRYPSPDGLWEAVVTIDHVVMVDGEVQVGLKLDVVQLSDGTQWTLVDGVTPSGLGLGTPLPLHWAPDGNHLVFMDVAHADGCGLFPYMSNPRIAELNSGAVTAMWPALEGQGVALSPDGAWMAAVQRGPESLSLQILDVFAGTLEEIALDGDQGGGVVFDPAGETLALTVALSPCSADWTQAIVTVDLASFAHTIVWGPEARLLRSVDWTEDGIVLVDPASPDAPVVLDVATGEVREE